jgi:predicted ATP-dependent serine protease
MKKPIPYSQVEIIERDTVKFGDPVFDKFISSKGGIELGTMIALSGTSGAGKTTLCKKWQKDLNKDEVSVFYALESKKSSVAKQTNRIKTTCTSLICDVDTYPTWSEFMNYLYTDKPIMVIVDSLQHAASLLSKENGKYKYDNYKNIIKDLYDWKDDTQGIVILICQLNEKGKMEGPASTIFDVDCPIKLTADPKTGERFMETEKNRMGPIGKIFYQFVESDDCIKFYTSDEWAFINCGLSFYDAMATAATNYIEAFSNHKNYNAFRKEFMSLQTKGCKNLSSEIEYLTMVNTLIVELKEKYFE